jgi:hypothetical protein
MHHKLSNDNDGITNLIMLLENVTHITKNEENVWSNLDVKMMGFYNNETWRREGLRWEHLCKNIILHAKKLIHKKMTYFYFAL